MEFGKKSQNFLKVFDSFLDFVVTLAIFSTVLWQFYQFLAHFQQLLRFFDFDQFTHILYDLENLEILTNN